MERVQSDFSREMTFELKLERWDGASNGESREGHFKGKRWMYEAICSLVGSSGGHTKGAWQSNIR